MTTKEFKVQTALGTLSLWGRRRLARNERTSKKILTILSTDEDWSVRYWTADNPNTPIEVLKKLSADEDEYVRSYVADILNMADKK